MSFETPIWQKTLQALFLKHMHATSVAATARLGQVSCTMLDEAARARLLHGHGCLLLNLASRMHVDKTLQPGLFGDSP